MINTKVPCSVRNNYELAIITLSLYFHSLYTRHHANVYGVEYREKFVIASFVTMSRANETFFPNTSRFRVGTLLIVPSGTRD